MRGQQGPLGCFPHRLFAEDGITCFHQLVLCACIVMSWPRSSERVPEGAGTCGERENAQNKVITRGGREIESKVLWVPGRKHA